MVRVYFVPVFHFVHPKYTSEDDQLVILTNRKRLFRNKYTKRYAGLQWLFGGGVEKDDANYLAALARELKQECPPLYETFSSIPIGRLHIDEKDGVAYVGCYLGEMMTQEKLKHFAGATNEGLLDVVEEHRISSEEWCPPISTKGVIRVFNKIKP